MVNKKDIFRRSVVPNNLNELNTRLKEIMLDHIGVENEITKMELFKKLFGKPTKYNEMQLWFLWHKVQSQMHWLRKTSNCFIVSRKLVDGVFSYFVMKDGKDLQFYKDALNNNIKKMHSMMKRGEKLVEEEAYKEYQSDMKKQMIEVSNGSKKA